MVHAELDPTSELAERAIELCGEAVRAGMNAPERHEAVFSELDGILERADADVVRLILHDGRYRAMRQAVLHLRAAYEYEREYLLAQNIIEAGSPSPASAFRSADWYEQATDFEMTALAPYRPKRMLFVGAGPFPTSPFSYMCADPAVSITCLDRSARAGETAAAVSKVFGFEDLRFIASDVLEFTGFAGFDCVIIGLVVGISTAEKSRIAMHLRQWVPPKTLLAFRTAVGSGAVIYPSADLSAFDDTGCRVLPDPPHKSFTLAIVNSVRLPS